MRVLVIDATAKAEAKRILDFATQPENFYIVSSEGFSLQKPPGDDPRHVAQLHDFRCVFSVTATCGKIWRHLSISVPSKYPHPVAAFTIAELFGFTGWDGKSMIPPEGWMGTVSKRDHCIVLAQELREKMN